MASPVGAWSIVLFLLLGLCPGTAKVVEPVKRYPQHIQKNISTNCKFLNKISTSLGAPQNKLIGSKEVNKNGDHLNCLYLQHKHACKYPKKNTSLDSNQNFRLEKPRGFLRFSALCFWCDSWTSRYNTSGPPIFNHGKGRDPNPLGNGNPVACWQMPHLQDVWHVVFLGNWSYGEAIYQICTYTIEKVWWNLWRALTYTLGL